MTIRIIPYDVPTEKAIEEVVFSYTKLKAHPAAAAHAPSFKEKLDEAKLLLLAELEQSVWKYSAQAVIEYADDSLDDIVDGIDNATNSKNESVRRLRSILFGEKSPSVFKKPILGTQFTAQSAWLGPMQDASTPEAVRNYVGPLSEQLNTAAEAIKEKDAAAQAARDFKTIGARAKFIDALNALRKKTFAALDQLPLQDASLPRDFASRFFLKRTNYTTSETLEEEMSRLKRRGDELQEELSTIQVRLTQIEEERSKQSAAESARQAIDEELAAAERRLQELKAQRAKL